MRRGASGGMKRACRQRVRITTGWHFLWSQLSVYRRWRPGFVLSFAISNTASPLFLTSTGVLTPGRLTRASPGDIFVQPSKAKRGEKLYEGSDITGLIELTYVGRPYPNSIEKPTIRAGRSHSAPLTTTHHWHRASSCTTCFLNK